METNFTFNVERGKNKIHNDSKGDIKLISRSYDR